MGRGIHKENCQCGCCRAIRGEEQLHKESCSCFVCKSKRGEVREHVVGCQCASCRDQRGDPHKNGCSCHACKSKRGEGGGVNSPHYGHHHSVESRKKIGENSKKLPPETRKKINDSNRNPSPEKRKRMKETGEQCWRNPEFVAKQMASRHVAQKN